jgi:putative ABC transport system permease protein
MAQCCLRGLLALAPFELPASAPIRLNAISLAFTVTVALMTTLLFSLLPLKNVRKANLSDTLKSAGRGVGASVARQRMRSALVSAEVALSVALLASAGLLIQSLYHVQRVKLGFEPGGLLTLETTIPSERRRSAGEARSFEAMLVDRLRAIPGADEVAGISTLPLTGPDNLPTERENHPDQSIGGMEIRIVTPGYFDVMKIPIVRGRRFSKRDTNGGQPVALVNQALARTWWPSGNSLGDRVVIGMFQNKEFPEIKETAREVVGVAADTKTLFLKEPARPTVYIPLAQISDLMATRMGEMNWIFRTQPSSGLEKLVRRTVADVDARQRVLNFRMMSDLIESTTAESRFDAWLFGAFAALALVLTAIGLYGLLAFSVAQRTNEIGTRMALGASQADVLQMVLKDGFVLTMAGLAVGLVIALGVTRALASLLYGVQPDDPGVLLFVCLLLIGIGLAASYLPARRAMRVEPMTALRYE